MVDHRHKESWWPCQEFTPKARKCRQRWMWWCCCQKILLLTRKELTLSLLQQKSLSENHLQCILSYFTSPTLKRKSLQRRIEVTPASELCMQVHYFFVVVASRGHKKRGKVGEASSTNPFWLLVPQPWWWGPSSNNFMSWIFALMFTPQISVKAETLSPSFTKM